MGSMACYRDSLCCFHVLRMPDCQLLPWSMPVCCFFQATLIQHAHINISCTGRQRALGQLADAEIARHLTEATGPAQRSAVLLVAVFPQTRTSEQNNKGYMFMAVALPQIVHKSSVTGSWVPCVVHWLIGAYIDRFQHISFDSVWGWGRKQRLVTEGVKTVSDLTFYSRRS
jgi:hypothetical protein